LGNYQEEQFERNPVNGDQIAEAHAAYKAGDYLTLDDYLTKRRERDP